jgi:4-alpha-glucanotransferase
LLNHCRFEVLHAAQIAAGNGYDWRQWPDELRDPASAAVQAFAERHASDVEFHAFGQWLIDRGLQRAQHAAREAGMGIGLIADLAVGAEGSGSQAWSRQAELLPAVTVGAPPDILNRAGQSWGISAFSPTGLRQHGYRAFIEMLRANLAHAGGLRIDHVLGLNRLWVLPAGAPPDAGAYLHYPLQDMLRLLALESWRHKAVILGEDLGTVPEGLREQLAARGILGMRVLLFEQEHGLFIRPERWPDQALATTGTHDLPTMRGWWLGRDIDWRERIGHASHERSERDRAARKRECSALIGALRDAVGPLDEQPGHDQLIDACAAFIGMTPAPLALLPIEDALGLEEQPNLPGDIDKHPNWRRRLSDEAGTLLDQPATCHRLQVLNETRKHVKDPIR